jgi:hypothetical protein
MRFVRLIAIPGSVLIVGATIVAASAASAAPGTSATRAADTSQHMTINCEYSALCAEVANPSEIFGSHYVGHDEPSNLFYSNVPGSGNRLQYSLKLPRDPSPNNPNTPGKSYQFELNGAFWFGMALCATQSYPNTVSTCTPDSDTNIVDPAVSPNHPGTAFLELQFFPPGWVPWPTWAVAAGASGCDPTRWCAAMNIFSVGENPVTGTTLNSTCAAKTGIEYFNFAFLTKNGVSQAPANPVQSTLATFTPDLTKDLLMKSGDNLKVRLHDTPNGLKTIIHDETTGQTGSMTASAGNGFGQVQYDPTGTSCVNLPYDFHPMYSTSSEQTRVIWAAHSYNVAFADEIGHFENCEGPNPVPATPFGLDSSGNPVTCPAGNSEGFGSGTSPTDSDDDFCFPASEAPRIHINGCTDTNAGFDGLAYQPVWPDGNTALHPQPILFSSPLTGRHYRVQYSRTAFEADLPRIESGCNRTTGTGCALIPTTDKGTPVAFYPFFSAFKNGGREDHGVSKDRGRNGCLWGFGNHLPRATDFGGNAQYGTLLNSDYLAFGGGGAVIHLINNFRQVMSNPCLAAEHKEG